MYNGFFFSGIKYINEFQQYKYIMLKKMYVVIVYYVAFENNKRKLLKGCPFLFDNVNYVEHGFI